MSNLWDIAIATTQGNINSGLALAYGAGLLPTTFSQTLQSQGPIVTVSLQISGTFGAPTVSPLSVDSQTVQVTLPITQGTLSAIGGSDPISIGGMNVVVSLYLESVTSAVQPEQGTNYDLIINFADSDVVQSVTLTDVPSGVPVSTLPSIETAIADWLNQETEGQSYTVATVTLGNFAANAPYLVPTYMAYAFSEPGSDASDVNNPFAILMLTDGDTAVPTELGVPTGIIPSGQDFGALISNQILMSDILVPGLATALGTSTSSFTVTGGGDYNEGQVVKSNSTITVPGKGSPQVSNLTAQVENNALQLSFDVNAEEYGIKVAYTNVTASFQVQVTAASGGSQEIEFVSNGYNLPNPSVSYEWWAAILFGILGGVSGIISILLPLITAAVQALILLIVENLLPTGSQSSTSGFDAVLAQVQWNYASVVDIVQVSLPTPIQISGNLPLLD